MSLAPHRFEKPRRATRAEIDGLWRNVMLVWSAERAGYESRFVAWESAQADKHKAARIYACLAGLLMLGACK